MSLFYEPVSLGGECETKFQISRILYFQKHPDKTQASLQLAMMPPKRGRDYFPWRLFDCQGTAVPSICEYIERDFRGVFEREDLVGCAEGVVHRTLGTNHLHEFERATKDFSSMTQEEFLPAYEAARTQFEAMAGRFREMLKQPGPYLYVHGCPLYPAEDEMWRLIRALSSRSPDHKFHILLMGYEGEYIDTDPFDGLVTSFGRPYREFRGRKWDWWDVDYAVWEKALGQFPLGEHPVESDHAAPQQMAPELETVLETNRPVVSAPGRPSFMSRLLGRRP